MRRAGSINRWLLRCGVAAGPIFVIVFLIEGATRADYSPVRHPVSSLALGPGGWMQTANFILTGALYLAFAAGLARTRDPAARTRVAPYLIGATAVGLLGAGAFVTDPVSGYPPGTPDALTEYSTLGALHDIFSIPTFLGLPVAAIAYARAFRRGGTWSWATYSALTAVVMLALTVLASLAFGQSPALVDIGGVLQRAAIIVGFGWLTALAIWTLARSEWR